MPRTRAEIKREIEKQKKEKKNQNELLLSYKSFLDNVIKLIGDLDFSFNYLLSINEELKQYFNVDNSINKRIDDKKEEIKVITDKLKNTIKPSINQDIKGINNKINAIDYNISKLNKEYNNALE